MVLHEREGEPRPTYRLDRGLYDNPDKSEVLEPAIPEFLGGWNKEWPRNRIGLAQWLTDANHPLTARVTVNRYWQRFFGTGLVKTSENFEFKVKLLRTLNYWIGSQLSSSESDGI